MSCEVSSSILPSMFLKAASELYCPNESLFSLLAIPLDILSMCTCISLNGFETTLTVCGIELRSRYTTVRCTTCFLSHALSPFYLSVDGLTLFNDYQPIKCYEGICNSTIPFLYFLCRRPSARALSWSVFKESRNNNDCTD